MAKGAIAMWNDIRKKEHRASPLGQIEKKLNEFYDNRANRQYFEDADGKPNQHVKWIDIHRATTQSKQNTLEEEFSKEYDALIKVYKERTDALLTEMMTKEYEYLTKLQNGN